VSDGHSHAPYGSRATGPGVYVGETLYPTRIRPRPATSETPAGRTGATDAVRRSYPERKPRPTSR